MESLDFRSSRSLPVPTMSPWASHWSKSIYLLIYLCPCSGPSSLLHLQTLGFFPFFHLCGICCPLHISMMPVRALARTGGRNNNYRYTHIHCVRSCLDRPFGGLVTAIMMPILKMRRLKPREMQRPAPGHTASRPVCTQLLSSVL